MIFKGLFVAGAAAALAIANSHAAEIGAASTNSGVYSQPAPDTTDKEVRYSQPLIENPSYDPNLYSSFVPQDAVQQYVSHYGGPYGAAPSYFGQSGDPSFAVQTGYEGYLVPTLSPYGGVPSNGNAFSSFAKMAPVGFGLVKSLFPVAGKVIFAVIVKVALLAMSALGVIFAGGLVTSLICAFTPVCKLTFAGIPFLKLKDTAKQLTSTLETELTQERVKRAAELVRMALQKYNELQAEFGSSSSSGTGAGDKEAPAAPVSVTEQKDD